MDVLFSYVSDKIVILGRLYGDSDTKSQQHAETSTAEGATATFFITRCLCRSITLMSAVSHSHHTLAGLIHLKVVPWEKIGGSWNGQELPHLVKLAFIFTL